MPTSFFDITQVVSNELPVWPGDPPIVIETPRGTIPSVSRISMGSHAGTHVDPPAHFIPGGATVDELPLGVLMGPVWVTHLAGPGPLTAALLEAAAIPLGPTRLIIRTDNSARMAVNPTFDPGFVALAPDAADWVLARGIRLVGIDGPSIEPYKSPGEPVHHALLSAGVIIVENLALAGVAPGAYQLACLPLRIAGGDGAPVRAILITEEQPPTKQQPGP